MVKIVFSRRELRMYRDWGLDNEDLNRIRTYLDAEAQEFAEEIAEEKRGDGF